MLDETVNYRTCLCTTTIGLWMFELLIIGLRVLLSYSWRVRQWTREKYFVGLTICRVSEHARFVRTLCSESGHKLINASEQLKWTTKAILLLQDHEPTRKLHCLRICKIAAEEVLILGRENALWTPGSQFSRQNPPHYCRTISYRIPLLLNLDICNTL